MKKLTAIIRFLVGAVFVAMTLALSPASTAANWDSCADDLDRLRRAARDAADAANEVKSKADEFENCRRNPEIYDYLKDRCSSKSAYYRSALSTLESELDTVNSRTKSVSSSCGVDLSTLEKPVGSFRPRQGMDDSVCKQYLSYKGKLPLQTVLTFCIKSWGEADCTKCLSR